MLAAADTLILYMGVSVLDEVAASLLREGWGGETPSVALERAAMPWERRIAAPLKDIARVCREAGVQSPAVLVAGAAARNALRSRRILFTGLDPSNFLTLGDLLHWPALTVAEAPTARADFAAALGPLREGAFDWVAFTSRKGTAAFFALLEEAALDARVLGASRLIACGRGTAGTLRERGLIADAVPPEGGGAGILQGLGEAKGARVLLVQGTHALAWLSATLEDRGARVTRLGLHRVMPHPELGRPLPAHDIVYFSSPSGVAAWMKAYGADGFRAEVWCMGETTKAALAALGLRAEIVDPFRGPRGPAGTPR